MMSSPRPCSPGQGSATGRPSAATGSVPLEPAVEAGLEAYTRHTLVAPERLTRALTEVRELGWAAEVQEMTMGEAGIAAPIRGHGGLVVDAMNADSSLAPKVLKVDGGMTSDNLLMQFENWKRAVERALGRIRSPNPP